jgi:hypothetical protein
VQLLWAAVIPEFEFFCTQNEGHFLGDAVIPEMVSFWNATGMLMECLRNA